MVCIASPAQRPPGAEFCYGEQRRIGWFRMHYPRANSIVEGL